jgi:hypothetical protein
MKKLFYSIASVMMTFVIVSCSKNEGNLSSAGQTEVSLNAKNNTSSFPTTVLPKDILDLSLWSLSIPVDANGSNTGSATTIKTSVLNSTYTSSYFYISSDNGVVFWCPTDGATTSPGQGSDHPRTELRETLNWTMAAKGKLQSTLVVNRHPIDTADIIIGQIHCSNTYSSVPFVMLHLKDGIIQAVIKQSLTASVYHKQNLISGISTGTKIYYSIYTNGATIYFNVITTPPGGTSTTSTWQDAVPTDFSPSSVQVHFAAGDYVQDHTPNDGLFPNSTDGGRVTMYTLTITHY